METHEAVDYKKDDNVLIIEDITGKLIMYNWNNIISMTVTNIVEDKDE